MGKRPIGLGQAAKNKRKKVEPQDSKESKDSSLDEATPNLEIELPEEDSADEELAEVYGLFNKLRSDQDPQEQLKLARAVVHEADSLLRAREKLPAKGHVVYGISLLKIASFPNDDAEEKPEDFRKAGMERMDVGLTTADVKVRALAASGLVEDADNQMAASSDKDKVLDEVLKVVEKARSLITEADGNEVQALNQLLAFSGSLDIFNSSKAKELMEFCYPRLKELANSASDATKRLANKGLGSYYLYKATPVLEKVEDEEEPSEAEIEDAEKALSAAVSHFEQAIEESDPDSHVRLGETLLNLGNLQENESDQQDMSYAKALKSLKTAKLLGVDGLDELIESLE